MKSVFSFWFCSDD